MTRIPIAGLQTKRSADAHLLTNLLKSYYENITFNNRLRATSKLVTKSLRADIKMTEVDYRAVFRAMQVD